MSGWTVLCAFVAFVAFAYWITDVYANGHARQTGQSAGGVGWLAPVICILATLLGIAAQLST